MKILTDTGLMVLWQRIKDLYKKISVSAKQTTISTEDGGTNVMTFTFGDGTSTTLSVKNGSKGSDGAKGEKGDRGPVGETGPQGNSGIADASNKALINDAITGGETSYLSAEVGKLGILTYDCSKGGTIEHASLQDAINAVPTTFRKAGITIIYNSGDSIYRYTLKSNTWSSDTANWFSVEDKLSDLHVKLPKIEAEIKNFIGFNPYNFNFTVSGVAPTLNAKLYSFNCEQGKTYVIYHKTTGTQWTHYVYLQNVLSQAQADRLQTIEFFGSKDYTATEFTCNVKGGTKYILVTAYSNGNGGQVDFFIIEKDSIINKVTRNTNAINENTDDINNIKLDIGYIPYEFSLPISGTDGQLLAKLYNFKCEYGKTYNVYHKSVGKFTHHLCLQNNYDQAQASILQDIEFFASNDYTVTEFTCNVAEGTKYIKLHVISSTISGSCDVQIAEKDSILDKVLSLQNNGIDLTALEEEIDSVRKGDYGTSIFDVNKKKYFKNLFIQANWASKNGGNTPHISPLVMLWFSDIHGSQYNYNRLIEFKNYFNEYIQASICTGDIVNNNYGDDFSYFTANDIMLVIGNHDVQDSTTGEHSHIGLEAYNKYFAPFISNWGVIQPNNAAIEGLCYYYKDFTDRGIRLIVLDKMAWNSAQNTWLQGVLTDAKNNNLAVICANHYPANNTNLNRDCSFCSLYTNEIGGMPVDAINSIQSFIDDEHGEFICHINGHTHADYYGIIDGTTQISITIDCAYCNYDAWNDSDRVVGEKSADCFNILSIDTYDKTLKLFRVGVDRDRWLRHKGTMCLKYDTKELLWND